MAGDDRIVADDFTFFRRLSNVTVLPGFQTGTAPEVIDGGDGVDTAVVDVGGADGSGPFDTLLGVEVISPR